MAWSRRGMVKLATLAGLSLATPAIGQDLQALRLRGDGGPTLHYTDTGSGPPLIFVHGSLNDYRVWTEQAAAFAPHYRVITYSRRYNYPNQNPPISGYSAVTDAADLHGLIRGLNLRNAFIVGHSYGALAALFLMRTHPEAVRAAVLAEPPAVPLLKAFPGSEARGKAMYDEVQQRMVAPMTQAFAKHDTEAGLKAFFDYAAPGGWSSIPAPVRAMQMLNAREWELALTDGELFPEIGVPQVRAIRSPVLLLAGAETSPFLKLIDQELDAILPQREHVVLPKVGHPMWQQAPEESRRATLAFFARHGGPAAT